MGCELLEKAKDETHSIVYLQMQTYSRYPSNIDKPEKTSLFSIFCFKLL